VSQHNTEIVAGSVERRVESCGIAWKVRCCGEHEVSGHIQNAHLFSPDELHRIVSDHLEEVAEQHEGLLRAEEFVRNFAQDEPYKGCCP
jgi:hypothetical protein